MPAEQTKPRAALPPGAWDCHTHIFGPYERFPLAAERSYTPPEAPLEAYLAMLDRVGCAHGVLVQPTAYGIHHAALLDALDRAAGRLRGTAVATAAITDRELESMHRSGVRALRFIEAGAGVPNYAGAVGFDALPALAPRLRALGWHAQVWAPLEVIVADAERLLSGGLLLVLDHMGRFEVERGVHDSAFRNLLALLAEGRVWVKLTPQRNSKRFPGYEDLRPFHDALARANPERLIWGSDWPYLRMGDATPDAGQLLDLLDAWCGDAALCRKVLADNPARLYGVNPAGYSVP